MADLLAAQSARKEHWSMQSTRSKLSLGLDIKKHTGFPLDSRTTLSLTTFHLTITIKGLEPFALQSEKVDFIIHKLGQMNWKQLELPWIIWHRPTSWLTDQIQDWTETGN
jgi:hypothetical protein